MKSSPLLHRALGAILAFAALLLAGFTVRQLTRAEPLPIPTPELAVPLHLLIGLPAVQGLLFP